MEESSCVPPGFRFHPTEEELVGYYLARKVASQKIDLDIIQEVDLYRIEPWDLQERCKCYGQEDDEEQREWYFFSYKDRKYPSGTRTNRATAAGFWKATGRDKPVLSSRSSMTTSSVIGMRKTLVFYRGRAPNGRKTDWIIHEYRLIQSTHHDALAAVSQIQEEGWVVCRAFQKPTPNQRPPFFPNYYTTPAATPDHYYYYYENSINSAQPNASPVPATDHPTGSKTPFSDVPGLESPTVDCNDEGYVLQSATVDWNLLNSLLPSTQFLHLPSGSKNVN